MGNLTTDQEVTLKEALAELGLTEADFHDELIDTGNMAGPAYLAVDPEIPSVVTPGYITINSAAQLKKLGGIPDAVYEDGIEEHHAIPVPWPAGKNHLETSAIKGPDRWSLCHAYEVYLYGNSRRVQSYAGMIEKFYFPCRLPVFLLSDVVIRCGYPLIIEGPEHKPVALGFKNLTMEAGAELICHADAGIKIWNLKVTAAPCWLPGYIRSIGRKGDKASDGLNGRDGAPGANGSGKLPGCPGGNGDPGGIGGNGSKGDDAYWVTVRVDTLTGHLALSNRGGDGGQGGKGGSGGNGGQGGLGSRPDLDGAGGDGGDGGSGGNGGNGGAGTYLYLNCLTLAPGSMITKDYGASGASAPGTGGEGGPGGSGGAGRPMGRLGIAGEQGKPGEIGRPGEIVINGQVK